MKKTLKKVLASLFAAVLLVGGIGAQPVEVKAAEDEHTAFLMFTDRDWAFGNWDETLESATTKVTGDGSYSVTLKASEVGGDGTTAANGAMVFCVDVVGLQSTMGAEGKTMEVTELSVLADGTEVPVDMSKIVTGDIEEKGNFRIEIYNEYGDTTKDSPIDQNALSFKDTLTVNFTLKEKEMVEENTAFLMFTDRNWAFGNWDETLASATTTVAGNGTYTVTLNASEVGGDGATPASGAMVFCVDIVGLGTVVPDLSAITVSDVKVLADGEEVAVESSKIITGDIEEKGNFRIELYNEYGDTAKDSPIDQNTLSFKDTLSVTFTLGGIVYGAVETGAETEAPQNEFDPNGTYHAYIGVQTPTWIFRNAWDDPTYGKDSGCFDQMGFIEGDWIAQGGSFTDVEITGNGTYTVAVNGYDFSGTFNDQAILGTDGVFNLLFVSTDLPVNDAVVISNVVLKMDGKEITTVAEPFMDPDSQVVQKVLLANIWNSDLPALPYYAAPAKSIEITFTVSGFANDAVVEAPDTTPETTPESTPESTETPSTTPADDTQTSAPADDSSAPNMVVIIVVVVVVVVAAAVAGVLVAKKKKTK